MSDAGFLLEPIRALHAAIRAGVLAACERAEAEQLAAVASEEAGDTIYAIDRVGEALLEQHLAAAAAHEPLLLLAEGLPEDGVALPHGTRAEACRWRVLIDPIDGTRGLMYQKRSAWVLTAVALNRGPATRLRDAMLAVQTEIPLLKQHLCDELWAAGGRADARRLDRLTGKSVPLALRPSGAGDLAHGFATVARFFPGDREQLGAVDDELFAAVGTPAAAGKATSFEDQYASTGGQLYELIAGHDRFVADLRALLQPSRAARGLPPALCCHPYDLCTASIAAAFGVRLTNPDGTPLDAPFDTAADVAWVGYANADLERRIAPVLRATLQRRGLLPVAKR